MGGVHSNMSKPAAVPSANGQAAEQNANIDASQTEVASKDDGLNQGDIGVLQDHDELGQVRVSPKNSAVAPAEKKVPVQGGDQDAGNGGDRADDVAKGASLKSIPFEKAPSVASANDDDADQEGRAAPVRPGGFRIDIAAPIKFIGRKCSEFFHRVNDAHLRWAGSETKKATIWKTSIIGTGCVRLAMAFRERNFAAVATPDGPAEDGHFYQEVQTVGVPCAIHAGNAWTGVPLSYTTAKMKAANRQNSAVLRAHDVPPSEAGREDALWNGFSSQTVQRAHRNAGIFTDHEYCPLQDGGNFNAEERFQKLRAHLMKKIEYDRVDRMSVNICGSGGRTEGHWVTFRRRQGENGRDEWVLLNSKTTTRDELNGKQQVIDPITYIEQKRAQGAHHCEVITPHISRAASQDVSGRYARQLLGKDALRSPQFIAGLPANNRQERRYFKKTLDELSHRLEGQAQSRLDDDKLLHNVEVIAQRMEAQFPMYSYNDVNRVRDLALAYRTWRQVHNVAMVPNDAPRAADVIEEQPNQPPRVDPAGPEGNGDRNQEVEIELDESEFKAILAEKYQKPPIPESSVATSIELSRTHYPPPQDEHAEFDIIADDGVGDASLLEDRKASPEPPIAYADDDFGVAPASTPRPLQVPPLQAFRPATLDDMLEEFLSLTVDHDFGCRDFVDSLMEVAYDGASGDRIAALNLHAKELSARASTELVRGKGYDFFRMGELIELMTAAALHKPGH